MAKEREYPRIIVPQMEKAPYSLSGADLLMYADLWMYSRKNPYIGSYQALADWLDVPKTSAVRSIQRLEERGLVEVVTINAHKTSFKAKTISGVPLPVYRFRLAGYIDNTEPLVVQKAAQIIPEGQQMNQNGPQLDQNGPSQYNLYNTNSKNKTYKRENLDKGINSLEHAREIEAAMRERDHRLRDLHDIEASKPEAIEAGEAFFKKFFKSG